jgi:hypothetical protein
MHGNISALQPAGGVRLKKICRALQHRISRNSLFQQSCPLAFRFRRFVTTLRITRLPMRIHPANIVLSASANRTGKSRLHKLLENHPIGPSTRLTAFVQLHEYAEKICQEATSASCKKLRTSRKCSMALVNRSVFSRPRLWGHEYRVVHGSGAIRRLTFAR